jgi:SAM-dependent methyltransferase
MLVGKMRAAADYCFTRVNDLLERSFDAYMGSSTVGVQYTTSSDVLHSGGENWHYHGCAWPSVHFALKALKPSSADVFVDLGSGKGRALLVAGRLSYGRVVGVDFDAALAQFAQRNVDRARPKMLAGAVTCETANVLDWPFPDDATTVFLFNPFIGQTFRSVMARIFDSYDRNPRPIHIVYEHPWEHDWLLATGRVVVENVRSMAWLGPRRWWTGGHVITTYHVTGNAGSAADIHCSASKRNPSSKAMIRWSSPNGQRFTVTAPSDTPGDSGSGMIAAVKDGDAVKITEQASS